MRFKKFATFLVSLLVLLSLTSCIPEADVASENMSKAADQFQVNRRVIFYNGITGDYILVIEGRCSLGNYDAPGSLSVICKTSETGYKKHYLGLSDNVTYFAEQLDVAEVSSYHYKVIFSPSVILPDIDLRVP